MATVQDLLKFKGSQVWTIAPGATLRSALELMAEKNVGALVIVDGSGVIGIFSERDYATGAAAEAQFSLDTPVHKLMSSPVYGVSPDEPVDACITLMTEKRFRHLPVIDAHGDLAGLVSIGDVVRQALSEKEKTIKDLEDYIWVHMI